MTIASIFFNTEDAKESLAEGKKVVRGQVANFQGEQHKPIDLGGSMAYSTGAADQGKRSDRVRVNHESDICVLDADGGMKIGGTDLRSPGRMLVLQPSGLLSVHSESEDKAELLPYQNANPRR